MLLWRRSTCASLAVLLLLGACAGSADRGDSPAAVAAAQSTVVNTAVAAASEPDHSAPVDDLVEELKGEERTSSLDDAASESPAVDAATGSFEPVVFTALAPDPRLSASVVAARPRGTEVGYLLIDLETGQELATLNADLPLIPASTTKLATALVALDVLGPQHRFRTELLVRGEIQDGVLKGDLILRGDGDPALDVADLLGLAVQLEASGIRRVDGRFLIDDAALPRLTEIDPNQPLEAAYNPGIGALSLAFNRVRVTWRGGGAIDAMTLPPLAEAMFEPASPSRLPPGGIELRSAHGSGVVWRIADRGRRRQQGVLPVKDPGLHAGRMFRYFAVAQDVVLGQPERGATPEGARVVAVHESQPLRDLVQDMLVYSNNMMAEMIGLAVANRLGRASDLEEAGALMVAHLGRLIPDVDWRGATLGNHSGLDAEARLTPRHLAAILRYGWDSVALPALLPAGGWSGTLSRRFDDPEAALRVWAKTGTLNYGSALAGYIFPATQRPLLFVIMVSDIAARTAYDALPERTHAAERAAAVWNARARALEDELVKTWLEPLPTS